MLLGSVDWRQLPRVLLSPSLRDFDRREPSAFKKLEVNTGEVRANRNANYRVAPSFGGRCSDDGSALLAAAFSSACRSAIYPPAGAAAARRRKRLGGDAA